MTDQVLLRISFGLASLIFELVLFINTMDRMWFSTEQLEQGYRLGCQVYAKDEALEVEI